MRLKQIAKTVLPKSVVNWLRAQQSVKNSDYFAAKTPAETFTEIYENNIWGGNKGEFYSGSGSDDNVADAYVKTVSQLIERFRPAAVVDLGCGDFRVASRFIRPEFKYIGVDVVPTLISQHSEQFANSHTEFRLLDISNDELPDGEMCLIRQVLQHLSNGEIKRILEKCSKYRFLVITEHYPPSDREFIPNIDMHRGAHIRLNQNSAVCVDLPPFNLPNPQEVANVRLDDGSRIRTFLFVQESTADPISLAR